MRIITLVFGLCLVAVSGCQVIPTDMVPKVKWYWSKEAQQYRQDKENHNPEKHQ